MLIVCGKMEYRKALVQANDRYNRDWSLPLDMHVQGGYSSSFPHTHSAMYALRVLHLVYIFIGSLML